MKISSKQYAQALFELSKDKDKVEVLEVVGNFANFLVKNNDFFKLDKILNDFNNLWNREFSIVEAKISSAHPLTNEIKDLLKEYLVKSSFAKEVVTDSVVDKNILGGVVIKYGDRIFDASLKTNLSRLKQTLLN